MMRLIRKVLGSLIMFTDRMTPPKGLVRPPEYQKKVDMQTQKMSLYQFEQCPFCVRVRRVIRKLSLNIELRDTQKNPKFHEELLKGGGTIQVPCLRIEKDDGSVQWMYESADIILFLRERFSE
ncbi:MAG: glutathione S-transferase N-terminal domain-containing protein [Bdellovibrionia bacterium]